jgi:hypothetical protein
MLQNQRVSVAIPCRRQIVHVPSIGKAENPQPVGSRKLRRLLDIGVIKRVTGTYRYYLTKAGRAATAAAARLTEAAIIPAMI